MLINTHINTNFIYDLHSTATGAVIEYIKQTFDLRRWGRVGETGGPAHFDGVAICRSSNA